MGLYDNLNQQQQPLGSGVTTLANVMGSGSRPVGQITGGVTANPLDALRQQATNSFQDAQRQKQAQQIALGKAHPSGFQGFLQDVMSNPIVKTALKPLELLDYGRRGVISTVKEVGDLVTGNHASLQDWWNQTKDPTFGFGKILPPSWRKNKWADRKSTRLNSSHT